MPNETIEELARYVLQFWRRNLAKSEVKLGDFIERLASEIEIQRNDEEYARDEEDKERVRASKEGFSE